MEGLPGLSFDTRRYNRRFGAVCSSSNVRRVDSSDALQREAAFAGRADESRPSALPFDSGVHRRVSETSFPTMQLRFALSAFRSMILRHRRRVLVAASVGLTGMAATAFGLAPLAPDPADLPQRWIVETLRVDDQARLAQLEALSGSELELYRTETTRPQDTVESLLGRLGISDPQASAFLRRDEVARKILQGNGQKWITARATARGELQELVARFPAHQRGMADSHFSRLTVRRTDGVLSSQIELVELERRAVLGSAVIESTLDAAVRQAGLPRSIASQLEEIFGSDLDLQRQSRPGDSFSVVYEATSADGEPVLWSQSQARILAAEVIRGGQSFQAFWFKDEQRAGYYDPNGKSRRRGFLGSPVESAVVTSGFAPRFHPVFQRMVEHNGIDYGAPTGTPVRSVADGSVEHAGWKGGYGNTVVIRHGASTTTLYAHLSKIDVGHGQRVMQGQRIGAVGATGMATGPHLHFEVMVDGRHVDPLTAFRSSAPLPLSDLSRAAFLEDAAVLRAKLEIAASVANGTAQGD